MSNDSRVSERVQTETTTEVTTEAILTIPDGLYETIRRHGERTYPHECCGVLLGTSSETGNTVEAAVEAVQGVSEARVDLVWDPPWSKDRMSEAARLDLGLI